MREGFREGLGIAVLLSCTLSIMRNPLSSIRAPLVGDDVIVELRVVGTHVLAVSGESFSTHLNPLDINAFP